MPKLHVIIASTRPSRKGPIVAEWFADFAKSHGTFDVELVDLGSFSLPLLDEAAHPRLHQYEHEATKAWSAKVTEADAYVFVTPEYDYFAPASLVNAIQTLANEWFYKPVGILSYGGISGGLRSAQMVKLLSTSVKMMPMGEGVAVQSFEQYIKDGRFEAQDFHVKSAGTMLDELAKWEGALRTLRV